ncbi:MAG TPA: N,N-dimethylformamidase beta subunit family domain-containing protein, partial [Candidatus Angelobacter sp.]|nr:N,N-dimethylformamidase beta subunit family domain-containing protein [Candidatus Angelobacter sp.]
WVYANTGFKDGDHVTGLLGYEMDRYMPTYVTPASTGRTLLSQSPYTNDGGAADSANSSIYQAPSGAWVFASGTTYWTQALDSFNSNPGPDARIQQTTANILNAFINGAPSLVHDLKVTAPATATAGQAFSVSVVAENAQGAPVTNYTGTVHFSSSDTSAGVSLPPDSTLTNGQGTFWMTLVKAGAQTLTVSDAANALTTTVTTTVRAAAATAMHLTVPSSVKVNQRFNATVTLTDQFGNLASGYTGTVNFWTSDPLGTMPPDYTFTAGDAGSHTFSMILMTPPSDSISVMDTANSSLNDASPPITVSAF